MASIPKALSLFLLLMILASIASAQNLSKQQVAEEVADVIIRRFQETLDFNAVYNEFYVIDQMIRSRIRS